MTPEEMKAYVQLSRGGYKSESSTVDGYHLLEQQGYFQSEIYGAGTGGYARVYLSDDSII